MLTTNYITLDLTDVPAELLFAISAKADYNFIFEQGGEADYPHWADEVIRKHKEREGLQ